MDAASLTEDPKGGIVERHSAHGKRGEGVNRLPGVAVNSSAPYEQFMNPLCDLNVVSDNVVSDAIDTGVPS